MVRFRENYIATFLCLALSLFVSPILLAQNALIDSLRQTYAQASTDSARLQQLNALSFTLLRFNVPEADSLAHLLLTYGDSVGIESEEAAALDYIGIAAYIRGDFEQAMEYYERAIQKAEVLKDSVILAGATSNKGLIFMRLGRYRTAFEHMLRGSVIVKAIGFDRDYAVSRCNLGGILQEMGEFDQAEVFLQECLTTATENNLAGTLPTANYRLGLLAEARDQPEAALAFYQKSLDQFTVENDSYGKISALVYLGRFLTRQGQYQQARIHLDSALQIADRYNFKDGKLQALKEKGVLLYKQEKYKEALVYLKRALELNPTSPKNKNLKQETLKAIADTYAAMGEFKRAYDFHIQYKAESDSLQVKDKLAEIQGLQIEAQVAQKEAENDLLREQKDKQNITLQYQQQLLIGALLLLLLLGVLAAFGYQNYRQKQAYSITLEQQVAKRTAELQTSNQQLERFAYIASHDLKEPLRNIAGFVQLIQRRINKHYQDDPEIEEYLDFVLRNSKQMNFLLKDVLLFTTIANKELTYERVNTEEVISELKEKLPQSAEERQFIIKHENLPTIQTNRAMLLIVFKNLLTNAIKYNKENPAIIEIRTEETAETTVFSVIDNGIGIAPAFHQKIFDLFARLHNRSEFEGSGLGLPICQRVLEQLGGRIWLESEEGKGSTFYFDLPKR